MHKRFLRILIFIVGMKLIPWVPPTIAMDNEETPLSMQRWYQKAKKEGEYTTESTRLKKSIKHIKPECYQSVQEIQINSRWKPWKLDEPYYDISDYTSGCGTCCSIFCCLLYPFLCGQNDNYGGCYFNDDDLMCFDTSSNWRGKDEDTDEEGKVMTRRDALRVMDVVNREQLKYYSDNPELRVDLHQPTKVNLTPYMQYQSYSNSFTLAHHASPVLDGPPVNLGRSEEIKEYERKLKAKGMHFVAYDLK